MPGIFAELQVSMYSPSKIYQVIVHAGLCAVCHVFVMQEGVNKNEYAGAPVKDLAPALLQVPAKQERSLRQGHESLRSSSLAG